MNHPHLEELRAQREREIEQDRKDWQTAIRDMDIKADVRLERQNRRLTIRIALATTIVAAIIGGAQMWTTYHPAVVPLPTPAVSATP